MNWDQYSASMNRGGAVTHMVDQVECKRIGCKHFLECVVPNPPSRLKPIGERGTFFPSVRLDWSGAWFVACDHCEDNGEADES